MHDFDKKYWEEHWVSATSPKERIMPVNPYLADETKQLSPGTALDAGCGIGTEALWLAENGWQVTGADISAAALATAARRAEETEQSHRVEWVETDVARWEPNRTWDLVTTHYAHPDTGQLAFYKRLGSWVATNGTLLIVGHHHGTHHQHEHPEEATVSLDAIAELFTEPDWRIEASYEQTRSVGHRSAPLHDVVVRVQRIRV